MTQKEPNKIPLIFTVLIFLFIVFAIWILIIYPLTDGYQKNKECKNLLNKEKVWHDWIDDNHFNCCWMEVVLEDDEGYSREPKCIGFKKGGG